jgi:hypothetical protein
VDIIVLITANFFKIFKTHSHASQSKKSAKYNESPAINI